MGNKGGKCPFKKDDLKMESHTVLGKRIPKPCFSIEIKGIPSAFKCPACGYTTHVGDWKSARNKHMNQQSETRKKCIRIYQKHFVKIFDAWKRECDQVQADDEAEANRKIEKAYATAPERTAKAFAMHEQKPTPKRPTHVHRECGDGDFREEMLCEVRSENQLPPRRSTFERNSTNSSTPEMPKLRLKHSEVRKMSNGEVNEYMYPDLPDDLSTPIPLDRRRRLVSCVTSTVLGSTILIVGFIMSRLLFRQFFVKSKKPLIPQYE